MNIIDITGDNIDTYLPASEWLIDDIERGRFLAMGASEDEKPVGAMVCGFIRSDNGKEKKGELYHLSGDDAAMEALLDEYILLSRLYDVQSTIIETSDEKLAGFLKKHGFYMDEDESTSLWIEVGEMADNPVFKEVKLPESIVPLGDISPIEFRCFMQQYSDELCPDILYEIESVPFERYDHEISCAAVTDEGIDAVFLVRYDGNGTLYPEVLAGFGELAQKKLPYLLACSTAAALRTYPGDTKVLIKRRNRFETDLTHRILKGKKGETVYVGILD